MMTGRPSDLVLDSQLRTSFVNGDTRHVYYVSSETTHQRRVRVEETWHRWHELGQGAYGKVWLEGCVSGSRTGHLRAVKEILKERLTASDIDYTRELEAMAKFSHEKYVDCFVKLHGWYESADMVFIAMEYMEHGDLRKYMGQPIPEEEAQEITRQLVEGLSFMHTNDFAHRDLKPGNILVLKPGPKWWVKIGDFGITKRAKDGFTARLTARGTAGYIAPEIIGFSPWGERRAPDDRGSVTRQSSAFAVDIWALGEISFRMIANCPSFPKGRDLFDYVTRGYPFPHEPLRSRGASSACRDFIEKAMAPTPLRRLRCQDAARHPWIELASPSSPDDLESQMLLGSAMASSQLGPAPAFLIKPLASETAAELFTATARWSTDADGVMAVSTLRAERSNAFELINGQTSIAISTVSHTIDPTPPTGLDRREVKQQFAVSEVVELLPPVSPTTIRQQKVVSGQPVLSHGQSMDWHERRNAVVLVEDTTSQLLNKTPTSMYGDNLAASTTAQNIPSIKGPTSIDASGSSRLPELPPKPLALRKQISAVDFGTPWPPDTKLKAPEVFVTQPPADAPSARRESRSSTRANPLSSSGSLSRLTPRPPRGELSINSGSGRNYHDLDRRHSSASLRAKDDGSQGAISAPRPPAPPRLQLPVIPPFRKPSEVLLPIIPPLNKRLSFEKGSHDALDLDGHQSDSERTRKDFYQSHTEIAQIKLQNTAKSSKSRPLDDRLLLPSRSALATLVLVLNVLRRAMRQRIFQVRNYTFSLHETDKHKRSLLISDLAMKWRKGQWPINITDNQGRKVDDRWGSISEKTQLARLSIERNTSSHYASIFPAPGTKLWPCVGPLAESLKLRTKLRQRYGPVIQRAETKDGRLVMVKLSSAMISAPLHREALGLVQFNHENIVKLASIVKTTDGSPHVGLVFDLERYLDMREYGAHFGRITEDYQIENLFRQLLSAVMYIQRHWVIHGRLTPGAVLLRRVKDHHGLIHLQVTDFQDWLPIPEQQEGPADYQELDDESAPPLSMWEWTNFLYLPPERWLYKRWKPTVYTDVWSCGMLMADLYARLPLPGDSVTTNPLTTTLPLVTLTPPTPITPRRMKDLAIATIDDTIRRREDTSSAPSIIYKGMLKLIPEHRKTAQQVYASLFPCLEVWNGSNAKLGSHDEDDRIKVGHELGTLRTKASQHFQVARMLEIEKEVSV